MCFCAQVIKLKLIDDEQKEAATYCLVAVILFLLICFNPFHCFYRQARVQLVKTMGHIVISPFGKVRFRHFFFADVLTSMVTPL
mmetsp:Transcript_1170/g.802  ORF Transcript_1170/g.802 Transcript_1170/m.802 type:complete len:84 (+) Transcript_1170:2124-2375(+)